MKLPVSAIYELVGKRFAADGVSARVLFGWREPAQHATEPRVVFIPGDGAGVVGTLGPPSGQGQNPRALMTLDEAFTVLVQTPSSVTSPTDEIVEYESTRELLDVTLRALYLAAPGRIGFGKPSWVKPERKEARHGTAIEIDCSVSAFIADEPRAIAPASTVAAVDVILHEVTESIDTSQE